MSYIGGGGSGGGSSGIVVGTTTITGGTPGDLLYDNSGVIGEESLAAAIDANLGNTQGDILYRNATVWTVLAPGTSGNVLATGGPGANPSWVSGPPASLVVGSSPISGGVAGGILYDSGPGTLEESSNFTFNGTNTITLNGGSAIIGLPASNNWFDGYSGNTTLTGSFNVAVGNNAMSGVTSGTINMALGANSLANVGGGMGNMAVGAGSLQNTTGDNNIGVGSNAGHNITTGDKNTAIGAGAMAGGPVTGNNNVAIGTDALQNATTAGSNIGIGFGALTDLSTNNYNIAIGENAIASLGSGGRNCVIGSYSGNASLLTGSYNTIIGCFIDPGADVSGCIQIGTGDAVSHADFNLTHGSAWNFNSTVFVTGDIYTSDATFMHRTATGWSNGAGTSTGTLTNAPAGGNPTSWIAIDDNGTTRHIPAW